MQITLGRPIVCDLLLDGTSLQLPDPRYVEVLTSIDGPGMHHDIECIVRSIFGCTKSAALEIMGELVRSRILVDEDECAADTRLEAVRHWERRNWLEGLILHLKSRNLPFSDTRSEDPDAQADTILGQFLGDDGPVELWKTWPGRPFQELEAPSASSGDGRPIDQVLLGRRSNRPWRKGTLEGSELSSILHGANIETRRLRMEAEAHLALAPGKLLNSAFSAIETYVLVFSVKDIAPGLYHYDPKNHGLTSVREGLFREDLCSICIGQSRPRDAACAFLMSAIWRRYQFRYRHPRAYRTLLVNVAELAQKYITLATAFDLSTFLTPAFFDHKADQFLGTNGYEEALLYAVAIG